MSIRTKIKIIIKNGIILLLKNRWMYTACTRIYPYISKYYYAQRVAYYYKKELSVEYSTSKSLSALKTSISDNFKKPDLLALLDSYWENGEYSEIIKRVKNSTWYHSNSKRIDLLQAKALIKLERYEEAEKIYRKILKNNFRDNSANYLLGRLYLDSGRLEKAELHLSRCVWLERKKEYIYFYGIVLLLRDKPIQAREVFNKLKSRFSVAAETKFINSLSVIKNLLEKYPRYGDVDLPTIEENLDILQRQNRVQLPVCSDDWRFIGELLTILRVYLHLSDVKPRGSVPDSIDHGTIDTEICRKITFRVYEIIIKRLEISIVAFKHNGEQDSLKKAVTCLAQYYQDMKQWQKVLALCEAENIPLSEHARLAMIHALARMEESRGTYIPDSLAGINMDNCIVTEFVEYEDWCAANTQNKIVINRQNNGPIRFSYYRDNYNKSVEYFYTPDNTEVIQMDYVSLYDGEVLVQNSRGLKPSVYHYAGQYPSRSERFKLVSDRYAITNVKCEHSTEYAQERCIILANNDIARVRNYFHGIVLTLSRLACCLDFIRENNLKIVMPANRPSWADECMEMIGVTEDQIFPVTRDKIYKFNSAYILNPCDHPSYVQIRTLRESLWRAADTRASPEKSVFINRKGSLRRLCFEAKDVVRLAEDEGYEIIYPEDYTIEEQVRLFSRARAVAGFAGAGFTNLAFCPDNIKVLSITKQEIYSPDFIKISAALGHEYTWFLGHNNKNAEYHSSVVQAPYHVDLEKLKMALRLCNA